MILGMALSSISFIVTLWLLGPSIRCLAMIMQLTVTHLMSSFEVNYQLLDQNYCYTSILNFFAALFLVFCAIDVMLYYLIYIAWILCVCGSSSDLVTFQSHLPLYLLIMCL